MCEEPQRAPNNEMSQIWPAIKYDKNDDGRNYFRLDSPCHVSNESLN